MPAQPGNVALTNMSNERGKDEAVVDVNKGTRTAKREPAGTAPACDGAYSCHGGASAGPVSATTRMEVAFAAFFLVVVIAGLTGEACRVGSGFPPSQIRIISGVGVVTVSLAKGVVRGIWRPRRDLNPCYRREIIAPGRN